METFNLLTGFEPETTVKVSEKLISLEIEKGLAPYFELIPQVHLYHPFDADLRVDYMAIPWKEDWFPKQYFFIEVKGLKQNKRYTDVVSEVAQCVDYQHTTINDKRMGSLNGQRSPLTILALPETFGTIYSHDSLCSPCMTTKNIISDMLPGTIRLAGKFGAGLLLKTRDQGWTITIGSEYLWQEINSYGHHFRRGAKTFHSNLNVGSR